MPETINEPPSPVSGTDPETRYGLLARVSVIALMGLVLAGAGLLSAMTAMRFAIRGQEVVVPDLEGLSDSDAIRILAEGGLQLDLSGRRFSEGIPEGRILDQTPPAGTRVKRDRSVRVLLSLGERRFPVPEVTGGSFRSAQILLGQRGLALGNTIYTHTADGEARTVVYQSPTAGDVGTDDPAVDLLVSLGPLEQYYLMPDLTGQPAGDVVRRVRAEGFRLSDLTYRPQPGTPGGRVIRQQPPAGYKVSKNESIFLEVSQ